MNSINYKFYDLFYIKKVNHIWILHAGIDFVLNVLLSILSIRQEIVISKIYLPTNIFNHMESDVFLDLQIQRFVINSIKHKI